jgi:hypothetical protein
MVLYIKLDVEMIMNGKKASNWKEVIMGLFVGTAPTFEMSMRENMQNLSQGISYIPNTSLQCYHYVKLLNRIILR